MKKHIALTLIALLLSCVLTACNTQTAIKTNEEKYGYVAFPGTDWGMSIEECTNALGLKEDDVEIKAEPSSGVDVQYFESNIIYMGKERTAKFSFVNSFGGSANYSLGLTTVLIQIPEIDDTDKYKAFTEEFKKDLEKNGVSHYEPSDGSFPNSPITLESSMNIEELGESDVKTYAMKIAQHNALGHSDENISIQKAPLDRITLIYRDKNDALYEGRPLYISYSGFPAAVVNTAEKQLEAEKTN